MVEAVKVFFSYSHADKALRDKLVKHLAILEKTGIISSWHDQMILPGDEWDHQISQNLDAAEIILLLISADFLASDYCWDVEVKRAMARHEAGSACVIPVILRAVNWQPTPFGKLAALPTDALAITSWPNPDEAFENVSQGIYAKVEQLRSGQSADSLLSNNSIISSSDIEEDQPEEADLINEQGGLIRQIGRIWVDQWRRKRQISEDAALSAEYLELDSDLTDEPVSHNLFDSEDSLSFYDADDALESYYDDDDDDDDDALESYNWPNHSWDIKGRAFSYTDNLINSIRWKAKIRDAIEAAKGCLVLLSIFGVLGVSLYFWITTSEARKERCDKEIKELVSSNSEDFDTLFRLASKQLECKSAYVDPIQKYMYKDTFENAAKQAQTNPEGIENSVSRFINLAARYRYEGDFETAMSLLRIVQNKILKDKNPPVSEPLKIIQIDLLVEFAETHKAKFSALAKPPTRKVAPFNYGEALEVIELSLDVYNQAIEKEKEKRDEYKGLFLIPKGYVLLLKGDFLSNNDSPNDTGLRENLDKEQLKIQRREKSKVIYQEAVAVLNEAISLSPETPETSIVRAVLYLRLDAGEEACSDYRNAISYGEGSEYKLLRPNDSQQSKKIYDSLKKEVQSYCRTNS